MSGTGVSPPSPVFTRAGSNLPPSRGKGFVDAERAIFIVMPIGGAALYWVRNDMLVRSRGWGPRIREDNGGKGAHKGRPYGDAGR